MSACLHATEFAKYLISLCKEQIKTCFECFDTKNWRIELHFSNVINKLFDYKRPWIREILSLK